LTIGNTCVTFGRNPFIGHELQHSHCWLTMTFQPMTFSMSSVSSVSSIVTKCNQLH